MELLELLLILTAKGLVSLVSFGRWRGESWSTDEASIHSAAGSLWFFLDGQRVFTSTGLMFIGLVFYGLLFAVLLW